MYKWIIIMKTNNCHVYNLQEQLQETDIFGITTLFVKQGKFFLLMERV